MCSFQAPLSTVWVRGSGNRVFGTNRTHALTHAETCMCARTHTETCMHAQFYYEGLVHLMMETKEFHSLQADDAGNGAVVVQTWEPEARSVTI